MLCVHPGHRRQKFAWKNSSSRVCPISPCCARLRGTPKLQACVPQVSCPLASRSLPLSCFSAEPVDVLRMSSPGWASSACPSRARSPFMGFLTCPRRWLTCWERRAASCLAADPGDVIWLLAPSYWRTCLPRSSVQECALLSSLPAGGRYWGPTAFSPEMLLPGSPAGGPGAEGRAEGGS